MSELSSALGGSAPRHFLTGPDGKKYAIGLVTQNIKIAYEKELFRQARETLASMRPLYDREAYNDRLDALVKKNDDGHFSLGGEFSKAAMGRPRGAIMLLSLLMGTTVSKPNGEIDITPFPEWELMKLVAAAPDEVDTILKVVIRESFPNIPESELTPPPVTVAGSGADEGGTPDPKAQG